MDQDLPKLNNYSLLLQLGHTSDYHVYLSRLDNASALVTVRQARRAHTAAECAPLQRALQSLIRAPNARLPKVTEVGFEDDLLYWVADYVEGDTLDVIRKTATEAVPISIVLRLCCDAAHALTALHHLGHAGAILSEDLLVGADGIARLIPPLTWETAPRRELRSLAESLARTEQGFLIVVLIGLLWKAATGVSLASCCEGSSFPLLSSLAPDVSAELDVVLTRNLEDVADPESAATLQSFIADVQASGSEIATTELVRQWLLSHIRSRLKTRAHLLQSRQPEKPSAEIPLVEVPTDLVSLRLATEAKAAATTKPPAAAPPSLDQENADSWAPEPAAYPIESERILAQDPDAYVSPSDAPTSRPLSSVRHSQSEAERPSIDPAAKAGRAPLESALAEYAERVSREKTSSH